MRSSPAHGPASGCQRRPRPRRGGQPRDFEVDTVHLGDVLRSWPVGLLTLTSQPPTLEELFLRHYGDEVETEQPA